MKRLLIIPFLLALALPCLAWGLMKKATTIGARSSSANIPTNAPGSAIQGFGGENIQGFGGENIGGLP